MGKAAAAAAVFLVALAFALAVAEAAPGSAAIRRSRFLVGVSPPPSSYYDCIRRSPSVCLEAGSPGTTCCRGVCVNAESSPVHCGGCGRSCELGAACCGGKCVDLLTDEKHCGECFNECSKECRSGLCNYAD